MKKNLFISFILFFLMGFGQTASSQTNKGNFILGASSSLEFSSFSVKMEHGSNHKSNTLEITPRAGYFFANNLAIGVQPSVDKKVQKIDGKKNTKTTTMIFPFALLYFGKGTVKPFVQAAFGPGWNNYSYQEQEKLTGFELGGGLAFFINPNVSFDMNLKYASVTNKLKSTAKGIRGLWGFSVYF